MREQLQHCETDAFVQHHQISWNVHCLIHVGVPEGRATYNSFDRVHGVPTFVYFRFNGVRRVQFQEPRILTVQLRLPQRLEFWRSPLT